MTHVTEPTRAARARTTLRPFLLRMHFHVGLFVGPFIFVAALTGLLYVLTPQIESWLYRDALHTGSTGPARSLADQALAARDALGADLAVAGPHRVDAGDVGDGAAPQLAGRPAAGDDELAGGGAGGLEAAVLLTGADAATDDDVAAVGDLGGGGVPVLFGDAAGRLRARRTT